MVLSVYNKWGRQPNLDIVDALTTRFMANIKEVSMRNMSNMVTHCAKMDYVNHNLFNVIEAELLHRL